MGTFNVEKLCELRDYLKERLADPFAIWDEADAESAVLLGLISSREALELTGLDASSAE